MRVFRLLLNFYLDASIHVALAVYALVRVTYLKFSIADTKNMGFVIFLCTLVMYNFIKYGSRARAYIILKNTYEKWIQAISFTALGAALVLMAGFSVWQWLYLAILGVISLGYIIPFTNKGKSFRSYGIFKIHMVALVWACTTVLLPFTEYPELVTRDVFIECIQRFVFVLVIILPFEVRDLDIDGPYLVTLPRLVGIRNMKVLGGVLLIFFVIVEFLRSYLSWQVFGISVFVAILCGFFLWRTREIQSQYYSAFWVESVPLFWWTLLYAIL